VKVLINAAPLIVLAKASLLRILKEVFGEIYTTEVVMSEILYPLKLGRESKDIKLIKSCTWIRVIRLREDELRSHRRLIDQLGIDPGEASLAAVYARGFDVVLMGDLRAERKLSAMGIRVIDIADLLILADKKGLVKLREAAKKVWKSGYRTSSIRMLMHSTL